MSKTLEQLTGRSQAQEVSTAIGQAGTVTPTRKVVGESLAQDLMGMIKPAAQTVQEYNTASVKAAQRSAMDKKTELAMFIADQQSQITPDTDLREVQGNISTFYATNSNTQFDNEDAQNAFDDMYTKDAGVSVAQTNAKYEVQALKSDAEVNRVNNLNGISAQLNADIIMSSAQIDQHVDSMTAGGYYTDEQAYADVAYSMNTSLNGKYKINKNLPIYNEDGSVNNDMQMAEFNKQYGSMVVMDETGAVKPVGSTTDNAVNDIVNNWKSLKVAHTAKVDSFNGKFQDLMESTKDTSSNNASVYTSTVKIDEQLNSFREQAQDINNEQPLNKNQAQAFREQINDLKNQREISDVIERDVMGGDINSLRTAIKDGKSIELYDNHTGTMKPFKIKAEKYNSMVNKILETQSASLLNMDVTPKNQSEYLAGLKSLDKWEKITNKKSAFTDKQSVIFDKTSMPNITNGKDLRQAISFQRFQSQTNGTYKNDAGYVGRLEALFAKTNDKGEPLSDIQLGQHANAIISNEKATKRSNFTNKELDVAVTDTVEMIETGEGAFGRVFNAEVANGSEVALKDYIVEEGLWGDVESTVQDMEWADYGTATPTLIGGTPDQRVLVPIGVSKTIFVKALDKMRDAYNTKNTTDFDAGDIRLRTVYDKGSGSFLTEMYNKANMNELIGTMDSTSAYITEAKE